MNLDELKAHYGIDNSTDLLKHLNIKFNGKHYVVSGEKIADMTDAINFAHNPKYVFHKDDTHSQTFSSNVQITDIHIPFWSMVGFMVKWAIASIPAMIILGLIAFFFMGLLSVALV